MKTSRLRITLREVLPEVTRTIDVPNSCTLPELHDILQSAVGWTDSHLHQFVAGELTYSASHEDDELLSSPVIDESTARLSHLPARFTYLYDFGDGWEHDVEVLGAGADRPGCIDGEGTCPPEDCGGPYGFMELLKILADPTRVEHDEMKRWAGELREFDLVETDGLIRQAVGEVPASVRLVLDLVAGGVKLTPGGRLPRAFVRQVQESRPSWHPLGRPAAVEDDLQPLAVLHDVLRDVGLLRLSKGVLTPTRAVADDLQIVRRLRTWFRPGSFEGQLVELSVALLSAHGPRAPEDLAAAVYPLLGGGWVRDGRAMTVADVRSSLAYLSAEMRGLDLVTQEDRVWQAGPSAVTWLPRVRVLVRGLTRERDDRFE